MNVVHYCIDDLDASDNKQVCVNTSGDIHQDVDCKTRDVFTGYYRIAIDYFINDHINKINVSIRNISGLTIVVTLMI